MNSIFFSPCMSFSIFMELLTNIKTEVLKMLEINLNLNYDSNNSDLTTFLCEMLYWEVFSAKLQSQEPHFSIISIQLKNELICHIITIHFKHCSLSGIVSSSFHLNQFVLKFFSEKQSKTNIVNKIKLNALNWNYS